MDNIIKKALLVAFDCKMIMGLSLLYQIYCEFALGQQGVDSDILALDIN